jgi:hypothetical protein
MGVKSIGNLAQVNQQGTHDCSAAQFEFAKDFRLGAVKRRAFKVQRQEPLDHVGSIESRVAAGNQQNGARRICQLLVRRIQLSQPVTLSRRLRSSPIRRAATECGYRHCPTQVQRDWKPPRQKHLLCHGESQ